MAQLIIKKHMTMEIFVKSTAIALLLSTLNPQLSTCFAQGSLTPPGAPAPTMKSLSQIEPRTAVTNTGAVTISQPGSYYLTTNITVASGNAIAITADNVTLDLNGFTLLSTNPAATGYGILLSGTRANIAILNGHIVGGVTETGGVYSGSGFDSGIGYGAQPRNVRVTGLSVRGCESSGIYLGTDSTIVESCAVYTVGYVGIYSQTISDSIAADCGTLGISALTAHNCVGAAVGSGGGLNAYSANNCFGYSSGSGYGLNAYSAANCYAQSASGDGLTAGNAANCYSKSTGGNGLFAEVAVGCSGFSEGGDGLYSTAIAIGCLGVTFDGVGLRANIANSCIGGSNGTGTNQMVTHKYNMP